MPETLLVTGAAGLLGANLRVRAADAGWRVVGLTRRDAELTDAEQVRRALARERPRLVVHAAAMTNVDECERDPARARRDNVDAAAVVARACAEAGTGLIHVSTDSVFDGERGRYKESDPARPLNVYARTKLEAEGEVLAALPAALVLRTNFYGWSPGAKPSLAEGVLRALREGRQYRGFADVFFTTLLVDDLCEWALEAWGRGASGVLHLAGGERCSKFEFARSLAREFGLDEALVKASSIADLSLPALRPRDPSLDCSRAEGIVARRLPGVLEGLRRFKELERSGYPSRLRAATGAS